MRFNTRTVSRRRHIAVSTAIATIATGVASWAGVTLGAGTAGLIGAAGAGLAYGVGATAIATKGFKGGGGSGPGFQMPQMPAAPKLEDASKKAQLRAEERKRQMARSKSVMTNPLGLKDEAATVRKKLLGG
jgi:hypothetical protein